MYQKSHENVLNKSHIKKASQHFLLFKFFTWKLTSVHGEPVWNGILSVLGDKTINLSSKRVPMLSHETLM